MKILITGSNGYIAKALIKSLNNEHSIVCLSRAEADLTSLVELNKFFDKHPIFDAVIHTAITGGRRTKPEDSETIDQNIKMYYNLLENRNSFCRFISFGSGAEILALNTPYGISKRLIAESIKDKPNFYNLRIFAVFDENELSTRFIKSNILRYIRKEPMEVYENKMMDFLYMEDLINLIRFYLQSESPPKEIDCCYEKKYSLIDVADIINKMESHCVKINVQKNSKQNYIGESSLQSPGPIKVLGLEEGLKRTLLKLKAAPIPLHAK